MLTYGSVCSGIEAATVAWEPLGWKAAWFAEIEPYPARLLAYRYPHVPNLGDMTKIAALVRAGIVPAPDVLVGGTPCQAYSIAGLRGGLSDPRGQLTLSYVDLANAIDEQRPGDECVIYWENVPGVLSSKDNAFGYFLAGLAGESEPLVIPGGGRWPNAGCVVGPQRTIAWRVFDAQYFGVAQRRRRVFVVASARKGFDPAQLLFEFDGLRWDSPPSRQAEKDTAGALTASAGRRGGVDDPERGKLISVGAPTLLCASNAEGAKEPPFLTCANIAKTVNNQTPLLALAFDCKASGQSGCGVGEIASTMRAMGHKDSHTNGGGHLAVCVTGDVTHTLKAEGFDASEDGTGRGQPIVAAVALRGRDGGATAELGDDVSGCLRASGGGGDKAHALVGMAVRRLTPRECERLQAFPDDYTWVPVRPLKPQAAAKRHARGEVLEYIDGVWWELAADGPRYKALGNSMCVFNMRWLGVRLMLTHAI